VDRASAVNEEFDIRVPGWLALFKPTSETLRVSLENNTPSPRGNDNPSNEPHTNLTSESHKRKYTHRRPKEDYIRIYNNAPPGVPYSKLFEDKREYAYFRWVISQWKRGKLRKPISQQGHPQTASSRFDEELAVDVHHTPFRGAVPPHWIAQLRDTVVSRNRNGQVVYRDPAGYFGLVAHKNGSVQFSPYLNVKTAWERLEAYIKTSWGEDRARLFMDSLHKSGVQTHVAFHTPGVSQFRVKIPGIASIEGDRTPWRDGTSEVLIDTHDLTNTIRVLEEVAKSIFRNQAVFSENEARLAKNMESHLALIEELRELVRTLAETKSTRTDGTTRPTQPTTSVTDSPSSVLIKRPARIQTPRVSDCIHGWTVETVLNNYSKHVRCDECLRYNSCSTLNQAYELSRR
jgi:hypothetical protein